MKIKIIRKKEVVLAATIIVLNVLVFIWPQLPVFKYNNVFEFVFAFIVGIFLLQWDSIIFALYLVARKNRTLFLTLFCWFNLLLDLLLFFALKNSVNPSGGYESVIIVYGAITSFTLIPVLSGIVFLILRLLTDLIIYLREKKEAKLMDIYGEGVAEAIVEFVDGFKKESKEND